MAASPTKEHAAARTVPGSAPSLASLRKFSEVIDPVVSSSALLNVVMFFMPMIINYTVPFYVVTSLVVAAAAVAYEYQPQSDVRNLYIGNMLLGATFIWHSLPMGDVVLAVKITLTVLQFLGLGLYFLSPWKSECMFAILAMWFIPYDNYLYLGRIELHLLVVFYSLFWFLHEAFVIRYFKVIMPLQDTVVISLVMFRIVGPWLIIYFAVMNMFKGYLTFRFIRQQQLGQYPPDPEQGGGGGGGGHYPPVPGQTRDQLGPEEEGDIGDALGEFYTEPGTGRVVHAERLNQARPVAVKAVGNNITAKTGIRAVGVPVVATAVTATGTEGNATAVAAVQPNPVVAVVPPAVPARPIPARKSIIDTVFTSIESAPVPSQVGLVDVPLISNYTAGFLEGVSGQSKSVSRNSTLKEKFFSS